MGTIELKRLILDTWENCIDSDNKSIAFANEMLKSQRERDRELVEWVWSKGVLTKLDMEVFTKDFKSSETKYWEKDRRHWYRERAKNIKRAEDARKSLERMEV